MKWGQMALLKWKSTFSRTLLEEIILLRKRVESDIVTSGERWKSMEGIGEPRQNWKLCPNRQKLMFECVLCCAATMSLEGLAGSHFVGENQLFVKVKTCLMLVLVVP
ncbi:hypothetical protein V6N13_041183 [Hibiscus sabdariffa]|uniref:Uncharacterized protein n=1 Tax=Hibiscus sabdariffa TaxID=183260 RepID=A0ABR2RAK5_9ROSI